MEFTIPLCRDDLARQKSGNDYYVKEIYDEIEIKEKLREFETTIEENGNIDLLENFDLFYSGLKIFHNLDIETRASLWNCIFYSYCLYFNEICAFLQEDLNENRAASVDNRRDHRNLLQMYLYLLCQLAEYFENVVVKVDSTAVAVTNAGKGRGRGRKITMNHENDDSGRLLNEWTEQKLRFLKMLAQTLRQPLNVLWDTPIVDEQLINCIANVCYKIFENPETGKGRANNDEAVEVLGLLIKNYRHHSAAGIKIVQQLQHFEHLAHVWSNAVTKFIKDFHCQNVVLEIFRELSNIELDDLTKEGASARTYSSFLIDLAEKSPTVVLANISLLVCHLETECYTMRNCVLTISAELVMKKLQGEHLSDTERQSRDKFLDRLEAHLHDKIAFVRSKCFHLWTKMCEQNCIPNARLKSLLPLVIGRLVDKGSTVRKGAIQLLTMILRNNPYMAKLSVDDMRLKLENEKEKLKTMQNSVSQTAEENRDLEVVRNADILWSKITKQVEESVDEWIDSHYQSDGSLNTSTVIGDLACDVLLKAIYSMIIDKNYAQACGFAVLARLAYPEHRVFQQSADLSQSSPSLETTKLQVTEALKMIYLEHVVAEKLAKVKDEHIDRSGDIEDSDEDDEQVMSDNDFPELQRQKRLVRYLRDSKIFAEQLQTVLPQVSMMLRQTQTSDVLESIEFVVTCAEFGVNGSKEAVWKCCALIWSKEPTIKEAVVKAFERLFLITPEETSAKRNFTVVAQRLIDLVINANLSQRTCLEDVICESMKHKFVDPEVLQILWEKFAGKNVANAEESKSALKLLGMAAKAEKSIVKENFDLLVQVGLGDRALKDFEFARDTCVALEKLCQLDKRKDEEVIKREPYRLSDTNVLFERLKVLLCEGFTRVEDVFWTPMMERSIKVIFSLAEHADRIVGEILKKVFVIMKTSNTTYALLTRFVALIGQSALQMFIFVDVSICRELKRRNLLREATKNANSESKSKRRSVISTPRSTVSKMSSKDKDQCEEEMALAGASAEDVEFEYVNKLCEDEILADETILGQLSKIVVEVCKHQQTYNDVDLQAAAALALTKLMIVSSKFCELHLSLLFTLLERSELSSVRANIIISVGDLSFRFPNLIEPWTATVYNRLNDKDLNVRLNCLLVLNHLILNDMIKPKGHVADIALCTMDNSAKVASLAKKFFVEYSEKGNALYNLLPDIISRLSDVETKAETEDCKTVMKFLFSLIHKERQYESLVEKLCQRFQGTKSVEQCRFYSYCLTLIPFNDRCLKKLNENYACFANQLIDKDVQLSFGTILNAARKSAKVDSKDFVEDLEKKIFKVVA